MFTFEQLLIFDACLVWLYACGSVSLCKLYGCIIVGSQSSRKNSGSHIDASHSRQPLVKGERLVRYEVNAVMCIPSGQKFKRNHSGIQSYLNLPPGCNSKSRTLTTHNVCITPQGVPHLAKCNARATLVGT